MWPWKLLTWLIMTSVTTLQVQAPGAKVELDALPSSGRLQQAFQTSGASGISLVESEFLDQAVPVPFDFPLALKELPGILFHAPGSTAPRGPAALLLVWLST